MMTKEMTKFLKLRREFMEAGQRLESAWHDLKLTEDIDLANVDYPQNVMSFDELICELSDWSHSVDFHTRDEDCLLDEDMMCMSCGVDHSYACETCWGKGFHKTGCPQILERTD